LQTWSFPGLQKTKANIMAIINKDESAIFPKEEYEGTYKRFIEYLKSLLSSSDNKSNSFFSSKSSNPEEQDAILDGCVDIDSYYEEMNQLALSDKSAAEHLIERLEQIEREDGNNDITKSEVKKIVDEFLDNQANEDSKHIFDISNNN